MRRKIKLILISAIVVFLCLKLSVFIFLANFVKNNKSALVGLLSEKLKREITVKDIKVSFLGNLHLSELGVRFLNDDAFESFTADELTIHPNLLSLLKIRKNYLNIFKEISFHGGNIKLRALKEPLEDIKGRLLLSNGDFYLKQLKVPVGETHFICQGWVRDFITQPQADLSIETYKLKVQDLLNYHPELKLLKIAGDGKISARLSGQFSSLEISGEISFNNIHLGDIHLSRVQANFCFAGDTFDISPLQIESLQGQILAGIKISGIPSSPELTADFKINSVELPYGECSGELTLKGDLLQPTLDGKLYFKGNEEVSLEKIKCQLIFSPKGLDCKDAEVFISRIGNLLWKAEFNKDLSYRIYFDLPSVRDRDLFSFVGNLPVSVGVLELKGELNGIIGIPQINYQGELIRKKFGKDKTIKWQLRQHKKIIKIESILLSKGLSLSGYLDINTSLLQLIFKIDKFNFGPDVFDGIIKIKGNKGNFILENSVLSSPRFNCELEGKTEGHNVGFEIKMTDKKVPFKANVNLNGTMTSSGFNAEILVKPISIQDKTYPPITAFLKIDNQKLIIEKANWLGAYFLNGQLIFSPLKFNFGLKVEEGDIIPILAFSPFLSDEDNYGKASGEIECYGEWPNLNVKGIVEMKDSKVAQKNIEYAKFQFAGIYPYLTLIESPVIYNGTTLICAGPIDFSKPGKGKFQGVDYVMDESQMVWDGWKIKRGEEKNEISLTKEVEGGFAVRLKTPTGNEIEDNLLVEPGPEVELEYTIKGKEKLKFRIDEEDDFVGIEHKINF